MCRTWIALFWHALGCAMLSAVLHTIARHGLFSRGGTEPRHRVLVAASGGPDSMALLAVLWELAPRLGLNLEVATVDHGLRPEAAAEAALVAERAASLGVPWHLLEVEVGVGGGHGGLQESARRARLAALEACAGTRGCSHIALGHQADDQAETILFRIVRGTGLRGLAGIPYRRGPFVWPLLDVSRSQIVSYLKRRSLAFAHDPSNSNPRFARSRIRHALLPLLRQENPRVDDALRRLGAEAAEALDPGAEVEAGVAVAAGRAGVHLPARLRGAVSEAARRGGTTSFDVAGGRRLTVSYGRIAVGVAAPRKRPAPQAKTPSDDILIDGAGVHVLGGSGVNVVLRDDAPAAGAGSPVWFDREQLGWPLVLRRPRPGDRMRPRGGRGSRKVADLFIDAKIPKSVRADHLVVASSAGEILFVRGLRPSQVAAPTAATGRWLGLAALPTRA